MENGTPITIEIIFETIENKKEQRLEELMLSRRLKYKRMRKENRNWKRNTINSYTK